MVELVIKIPENVKIAISRMGLLRIPDEMIRIVDKAIQHGEPLPKGHGRLIDADAFISTLEDVSIRHRYKELLLDDHLTIDDVIKAVIESLQNEGLTEGDAPTIITADKEVLGWQKKKQ